MKNFIKFAMACFIAFVLIRSCLGCGEKAADTNVGGSEEIPVIDNGKINTLLYPSPDVYTAEMMLEGSGWKRKGNAFFKDLWLAEIKDEPEWVKIEAVLYADNKTGKVIANALRDYYMKIYFMFNSVEGGILWGVYDGKIYNGRKKEQTDQYILLEYICDDIRYCKVTYATKKKNAENK